MLFVALAETFVRWLLYAAGLVLAFWLYVLIKVMLEARAARTSGPTYKELEDLAWAKGPEVYEDFCIANGRVPTKVWSKRNGIPQQR